MTDTKFLLQTAHLLDTAARKVTGGCCGAGEWVQMTDAEAREIARRLREIARMMNDADTD